MKITLLGEITQKKRSEANITVLSKQVICIFFLCVVFKGNCQLFKINYAIADSANHYYTDFSFSKKTKNEQISKNSNFDFGLNLNVLGYALSKHITMGTSYFYDLNFYDHEGISKHGCRWYTNLSVGSDYLLSIAPGIVFCSSARNNSFDPNTILESSNEISLLLTENIGITSKIDVLHLRDRKDLVDISMGIRCRGNKVNSILGITGLIASAVYMSIINSR